MRVIIVITLIASKTPTTDATTSIVITSIFSPGFGVVDSVIFSPGFGGVDSVIFSPGFGVVDSVIFAVVVVSKSEKKNVYFIMNDTIRHNTREKKFKKKTKKTKHNDQSGPHNIGAIQLQLSLISHF